MPCFGITLCLFQHYFDKDSRGGSKTGTSQLRKYVDEMLKDLKKAHKIREEQLSSAAHNYKQRMEGTGRRHEELLVCYRQGSRLIPYIYNSKSGAIATGTVLL